MVDFQVWVHPHLEAQICLVYVPAPVAFIQCWTSLQIHGEYGEIFLSWGNLMGWNLFKWNQHPVSSLAGVVMLSRARACRNSPRQHVHSLWSCPWLPGLQGKFVWAPQSWNSILFHLKSWYVSNIRTVSYMCLVFCHLENYFTYPTSGVVIFL